MKEIRKLKLSEGQLLSFEQQDAIVAGARQFDRTETIGSCLCSYKGPTFHTSRIIAYYTPDYQAAEFAHKNKLTAMERMDWSRVAYYEEEERKYLEEISVCIGIEVTFHKYDQDGNETDTYVLPLNDSGL